MNKKLLYISLFWILVVISLGIAGYFGYSYVNDLRSQVSQKQKDIEAKQAENFKANKEIEDLNTNVKQLSKVLEDYKIQLENAQKTLSSPYLGWKTYSSNKLGISFKYPPQFIITDDGKSIDISTYTADTKGNNSPYLTSIIVMANNFQNSSSNHSSPSGTNTLLPSTVKMLNNEYKFITYSQAEGNPWGISNWSRSEIKIGNNLFFSVQRFHSQSYSLSAECESYYANGGKDASVCANSEIQSEYSTTAGASNDAVKVLESVKRL